MFDQLSTDAPSGSPSARNVPLSFVPPGEQALRRRKASGTYSVLVNFDPEATDLLKDFRLLQGIGLVDESTHGRQLIQIKWIKARYPSYRALADTLRTYELAVQRVTPDIEILTASARKQAQECIKEGVLKHKWTKPVVAEQYAIELVNVVRQFEEVVDGLLDNYRELEAKMAELEKCPAGSPPDGCDLDALCTGGANWTDCREGQRESSRRVDGQPLRSTPLGARLGSSSWRARERARAPTCGL